MSEPLNYFMDDAREAARLQAKVDARSWTQKYLSSLLHDGQQVLDVGCGPGTLACEVARQYPSIEVTGLDFSADRIQQARSQNLQNTRFYQGNAVALPFEDKQFDLVYSRFMLEYLAGRQQAIREMARVCRPGGLVLLQDLDGQLVWHYPPDDEMERMMAQVIDHLQTTGFDPFIGRKLFSMAREAGLQNLQVQAESYHLYAGKIDAENLGLWELKLDIALKTGAQVLGQHQAQELKQRILVYLKRDDTLTYSVVFTVTGEKQ